VRLVARPDGTPVGLILLTTGIVAGAAVALFHLDHLPFVFCWFKLATGHPCMSCGTTRAVGRLAHGDVAGAWVMNPLSTVVALGLVPWALADLALVSRRQALGIVLSAPARRVVLALGAAALLINWAYLVAVGR
jgi:Protein of unknown function (DUF2752)